MLVVIVGLAIMVGIFAFYVWNRPEKVVIVEERWYPWYGGWYGPSHRSGPGPSHRSGPGPSHRPRPVPSGH